MFNDSTISGPAHITSVFKFRRPYLSIAAITVAAGTSLARAWVMVVRRQCSLSTPARRNPTMYSEVAK
jgi:hypothetical protein